MENASNLFKEALSCLTLIENNTRRKTLNLPYLKELYERIENIMIAINSSHRLEPQYQPSLDSISESLAFHQVLMQEICEQHRSGTQSRKEACYTTEGREGSARETAINDMIVTLKKSDLNGMETVVGVEEAKQTLKEACILPTQYPHLFQGAARPWRRILMYGPPGTGKTLLAKGIASELGRDLFYVSSASLLSSWIGESEKLVRELFRMGREKLDESIIFIDEIDSLCRSRSQTEDEHSRRVKTELLRQLEGVTSGDELFVLAATNCPWDIDHAFLRRFQRRIFVPLPKSHERKSIIERQLDPSTNFIRSPEDWNTVLQSTEGYSGADLTHLVTATVIQPIRELSTNKLWIVSKDKICPAEEDNCEAAEYALQNLPNERVVARPVAMKDFLNAVESTPRTVSDQMIDRYIKFSKGHY